ncbi:MAG TPA: nitroreductase family protein, partial [Burkholderiaceae bacterium]|nr:nitroreductase family protein [Burkholderiaceae bacterium]
MNESAPACATPVDQAILTRRSVRAYLPTPVPRAEIEALLQVAARAPSGTNIQPWKVHVLTGEAKDRLSAAILAVHNDPEQLKQAQEEYAYY